MFQRLGVYKHSLTVPLHAAAEPETVLLERIVGTPPVHNWDAAIEWANNPDMTPILQTLKNYDIPAATIGHQLDPDPANIAYGATTVWCNPQVWWMAGFGLS